MNISEIFWKNFENKQKMSCAAEFFRLFRLWEPDEIRKSELGNESWFSKKIPVDNCNGDEDFVF